MWWRGLLVGLALAIVGDFAIWTTGCDENIDCGGASLAAYYALLPLGALWIGLFGFAITRWWRHRKAPDS